MKFEFVNEKKGYSARIKVIGVGGAGGNAINNMIDSKLRGVDFIVANTDCQDLDRSACSHKIQLGPSVTMGLGAGADPEQGKLSAEESINELREAVEGTDMVFITVGMGGGTGTGASPIVARECKESGALTVAVATKPFKFEGDKRMSRAMDGIENLKREVDSLIIIPNERLKSLDGSNSFRDLILRADEVLLEAVRGISDLIMSNGFINLDFADVKKVMSQTGTAIMGMGRASGENRATEAAQQAINSPLLEDISISGAKGLLMNITGPEDISMDEVDEASNYIKGEVSQEADIFWGMAFGDELGDEVQVTVIATGIDGDSRPAVQPVDLMNDFSNDFSKDLNGDLGNVVKIRELTSEEAQGPWTVRNMQGESLDIPTYQRKGADPVAAVDGVKANKSKKGFLSKLSIKDNLDCPTFLRVKAD